MREQPLIPASEKPHHYDEILVFCYDAKHNEPHGFLIAHYEAKGAWKFDCEPIGGGTEDLIVTHWCDLPRHPNLGN